MASEVSWQETLRKSRGLWELQISQYEANPALSTQEQSVRIATARCHIRNLAIMEGGLPLLHAVASRALRAEQGGDDGEDS